MSRKRRAESLSEPDEDESSDTLSSDSEFDSDDGSSGAEAGEEDLVNCDFEFFDPQKQDFLGIKHLLRQLFDIDADSFDLGGLAEMVLAQPLVGTTVKTEGNESDPLSFLTALNLRIHKDNPVIKELLKHFMRVSKENGSFHEALSNLLKEGSNSDVGLVLSERIINMPAAVVSPSYKMLLEEIQWANEDKEPYDFTHYLIVSRTYVQEETNTEEDNDEQIKPRPKKKKRKDSLPDDDVQYFHFEDELFSREALHVTFPFSAGQKEDEDLKTFGLLMLVGKKDFESAIGDMGSVIEGGD